MDHGDLTIKQILNRSYKDLCGFDIPKSDTQKIRQSKGSPVYGEITYGGLEKLLAHLRVGPKDVFYDLGSGVGKVIIHTALATKAKKIVGVELSRARHDNALEALKRARSHRPDIKSRVSFANKDLMRVDLSDASLIYTCSTAFSLLFMKKVNKRLASFNHDFRLISLQDLPKNKDFVLEDSLKLNMTWTRNTSVNIYRRTLPK